MLQTLRAGGFLRTLSERIQDSNCCHLRVGGGYRCNGKGRGGVRRVGEADNGGCQEQLLGQH